jgi:hypothetical protein
MKNSNILLTLTFVFVAFTLGAQNYAKIDPAFKKGRIDVQLGVGLTPTFIGDNGTMTVLPLFASIDYLVGKKLSLGAYGAHSVTEGVEEIFVDGLRGQWRNHHSEAGVRIGIHFLNQEKWDFYGGLNLGVRHNKIDDMLEGMEQLNIYKGIKPVNTSFAYGGFVGARYAFKERLSAFGEAGTGASLIKVGIGFCLAK